MAPIDIAPKDIGVSTHEDHDKLWFVVKWSEVNNFNEVVPILGYKVKICEVKKVKYIVYTLNADGKFIPTEVEVLPELDPDKDPNDDFTVIDIPAGKSEATYHGMKKGVTYEISVYAYTSDSRARSKKIRVQVEPDKSD